MIRVTTSGLRLRPSSTFHRGYSPTNNAPHAAALQPIQQLPVIASHHHSHPRLRHRRYATQRRAVTPFNDDGHVPWSELSATEKTGRAAQQTFNFGLVVLGLALTGGVGWALYSEVFSPDSKTTYYNRAVNRIRADPRCLELLVGPGSGVGKDAGRKIEAYGEETHNKWRRARPIASTTTKDAQGNEHLMIQFNVKGPAGIGRVNMHLIKRPGHGEYEYKYFFVDVRGHRRIYLENADAARPKSGERKGFKLFGVNWSQ
ncbi:hypothetical protein VTK26DRAFT_3143 [Humicola hyalothermophila]